MASATSDGSGYEEVRRKRILQNLKHLEDLGISKISKDLLNDVKSEKQQGARSSLKLRKIIESSEVRRSSRARNPVTYTYDFVDKELPRPRRRYGKSDATRDYTGRIASWDQQVRAVKKAEKLQSKLDPNNPSFVKPMVRSHVSSCFWLGLPTSFCKKHMLSREYMMVLEDENGQEFDAVYIGSRTGLSGGWRGFALEHNLEDGDCLVFELSEQDRFKIYIIKAIEDEAANTDCTDKDVEGNAGVTMDEDKGAAGSEQPVKVEALKGAQRRKHRRR